MKLFREHTLSAYSRQLSLKIPAPGGGSAAALVAAIGSSLMCMVVRYSQKRKHSRAVESRLADCLRRAEKIRRRLLVLVDLDAKAYLQLTKTPKTDAVRYAQALRRAQAVPLEIGKLCYAAIQLTPFLARKGNPYLLSDVRCAVEMLLAAFQSAMANVEANQR